MILKIKKGFTLLEVMVALIIFSIGLIGLAGLQAAGMRNHQISYSRTYATNLAYDLADRIRNNPTAAYAGLDPSSSQNCVTNPAGCNPTQIAEFDLYEWTTAVSDPDGPLVNTATFITPNAATTGFNISIGWDEEGAGVAPESCSPPTPDTVACVTVNVEP